MYKKEIIIIGAGVAGLAAGCYLQMNGYKTRIFEMGKLPGGVCTSWKRKSYIFDGCINWLVGSGPAKSSPAKKLNTVWNELHALDGKEIVNYDIFTRIEYGDNKYFDLYTDVRKLEAELRRIAPEDGKVIRELIRNIKTFSKRSMKMEKPPELYSKFDLLLFIVQNLPFFMLLKKWSNVSLNDFSKRFKNPEMREILSRLFSYNESCFSMVSFLMLLAVMGIKAAGYPIGGSLEFAKSIERRYLELGGGISYNSKAVKILTENDKAVGIRLENGEEHRADIVISAADGHYTIFEMLDGKYINEEIADNYKNLTLFPACIQVCLGIGRDFAGQIHSVSFPIEKPIQTSDKDLVKELTLRLYNFDPTLAPKGKTSAVLFLKTDYEYWEKLRKEDMERYVSEKNKIAAEVIEALDKRFGDIKSRVEVVDVATPATYVRYTNNWKSSWEGWYPSAGVIGIKIIKKVLPGLGNFYMTGQWVEPGGGLPAVTLLGRTVAQIICHRDGKKFTAAVD